MKIGNLSQFEELLLLAILSLQNDAYGVDLKKVIEEKTGRTTSYGAVYSAIDKLEGAGLISCRLGEVTPEKGGRAKRYYNVDAPGMRALEQAESARRALSPAPLVLGQARLVGGVA